MESQITYWQIVSHINLFPKPIPIDFDVMVGDTNNQYAATVY